MNAKIHTLIKYLALLCALAALLGLAACEMPYKIVPNVPEEGPPSGEESQPGDEPAPGEGEIFIEFEAERANLAPGECTMLSWAVEGGGFYSRRGFAPPAVSSLFQISFLGFVY